MDRGIPSTSAALLEGQDKAGVKTISMGRPYDGDNLILVMVGVGFLGPYSCFDGSLVAATSAYDVDAGGDSDSLLLS